MKTLFLGVLFTISSLFAASNPGDGGGGMDSGGGNAFRLSEKTITNYIEGDLKVNIILTLQALEKFYKTERKVPYSTTIKNDAQTLKALSILFDQNSVNTLIKDVEISKYDLIRGPCRDSLNQETMSSAVYDEQGGDICLSLPLIQKTTLRYEELAYENALVALLIHEHLHHFQKNSSSENEMEGEAIQTLVLISQAEVKLFYSEMDSSRKIGQVLFDKMSDSLDIRSRRFASLQATNSDQIFINVKVKFNRPNQCSLPSLDIGAFRSLRLFTTNGSTVGYFKREIDLKLSSGINEFTIAVPANKIQTGELLVADFSLLNGDLCPHGYLYSVSVIKNGQTIAQRNDISEDEDDPSTTAWGLPPRYFLYFY